MTAGEDTTAQLREQIAELCELWSGDWVTFQAHEVAAILRQTLRDTADADAAQVEAAKATAWYEGYSACASMPRITNPDPDTWPVRPANPYRAAAPVPATPEDPPPHPAERTVICPEPCICSAHQFGDCVSTCPCQWKPADSGEVTDERG